ncbi:MAG TPA: ABC transporter permease [Puia sp.]|nr:ABC transporter permease [Puia sp.]
MLHNYFKTALRNLWKSKGFSVINIVGLAIGLATCLLILIFVMDELAYDRYNEKADRIYRVDGDIKFGGNHFILAVAPAPAGPALLHDYPEVEKECRFRMQGGRLVKKGDQNIQEDAVVYADSTLFDVFTLPMLYGNPHTALLEGRSVVITEKMAKKYFDAVDVVGRTLTMNDTMLYKVTGVIRDIPEQSHFHYDFFLSMTELDEARQMDQWLSNNFNTYIVLRKGADPAKLEAKFGQLITKYIEPELKAAVNVSADEFFKAGNSVGFSLTPLTAIHLHSNKTAVLAANGNIQYVYIFSAIAAFILLIACVNFMNLSTARSSNRAKEVGIRKVLGSLRGNLISQFMMESLLLAFISMLLALGLAWLLLPVFNQLSGKHMVLGLFSRAWLAPAMLGLVVVVGLLAGSYPAFYLSAFRPILVLKGDLAAGFRTGWLRNSLVVFQFGISIFLLVGTAVIYRQLGYIHDRSIGFNREQVMIVNGTDALGNHVHDFKEQLGKLPGVRGVTMTGFLPTGDWRNDDAIFLTRDLDPKKAISMQTWQVDEDYVPVLGMQMAAGRNFSRDFKTDSNACIVNEASLKLMQGRRPIGSNLYELNDIRKKTVTEYHIIGVIKDFNFNSLREVVTPMVLYLHESRGRIALRVGTSDVHHLIGQVEQLWHRMAPSQPFGYTFMDDEFNNIYRTEQRQGGISLSFSLLAIFIACLGLFGLAAYAAEQRTREIGIRKVLGASVSGIVRLLSRDFLRLVVVAAAISFPLAWWAMHHWLQDFAYRVTIGWEIFALAGAVAVAIALVTVSFQAVRAALANPVNSLRSE